MNSDGEQLPADLLTPVGAIGFTKAAVDLAREFLRSVRNREPGKEWVICFLWSGSATGDREDELVDPGDGLSIGVYERNIVPASRIETIDGVPIVIVIVDPGLREQAAIEGNRRIDLAEDRKPILRVVEPGSP